MLLQRQTKSSTPPVSVDEIKRHLNIDFSRDDDVLLGLIWAADDFAERETERVYVSQSWQLTLGFFPFRIYLPMPPAASAIVKYYDGDNDLQTLDSADYYVMLSDNVSSYLEPTNSWPSIYDRPDAVQVTFVNGDSLPPAYTQLIRLLVGGWYENRESEIVGTITSELKIGVGRLVGFLKAGRYQ
jgi:uncharacterized phiE125 gp8 family phage protein